MSINYYYSRLVILVLIAAVFQGCSKFDLDDFKSDQMGIITDSLKLAVYADTSLVLPRLESYSSTQKQLDSLIFFAEWLKNSHEKSSLFYAQLAYDISTEKNWDVARIISANRLAWLKGRNTKNGEVAEDAMVDAKISRRLLKGKSNTYWDFDTNYLMGYLFSLQADGRDSAREYFELALTQIDDLEEDIDLINWNKAMVHHSLAKTYSRKESESKLDYYNKSDSLFGLVNYPKNRARLWLDLGYFYQSRKKYSKADSLLNLCITYGDSANDWTILALSYQYMGYTLLRKGNLNQDFEKIIQSFKKSLEYEPDNKYKLYELIGNTFHFKYENEAYRDSAFLYYQKAFKDAKAQGSVNAMRGLGPNMVDLFEGISKEKEKIYKDSLNGQSLELFLLENFKGASETVLKQSKTAYRRINDVEQRDIEVRASNKNRGQLFVGLVILFIAAMVFLFALQRQQTKRLKAEMEALRAQINPHFISNSLNAIENLVNFGNTKAASKYLVHFSRLSRKILTGSMNATTNLEDELNTLTHFLALEQLRFRDKLTFDIKVGPNIMANRAIVPAMILQPYVENAIWHGIKPKPEGGHVQIEITREEKIMICTIADNGIGREKSQAIQEASVMKRKSVGMKITENRLRAMNKLRGSQVEIEDLKDDLGAATGTKIIIKLLYRVKKS